MIKETCIVEDICAKLGWKYVGKEEDIVPFSVSTAGNRKENIPLRCVIRGFRYEFLS